MTRILLATLSTLAALVTTLHAQPAASYVRRELTIPMRDGTPLFAVALVPVGITKPLPIVLVRTAFGAARAFRDTSVPVAYSELAASARICATSSGLRKLLIGTTTAPACKMPNSPLIL